MLHLCPLILYKYRTQWRSRCTYLSVVFREILIVSQVHEAVAQAIVWKSKVDNSQGVKYFGQHLQGEK